MMTKIKIDQTWRLKATSIAILVLCTAVVTFITVFMYQFTEELLRQRLDERVIAITSTAKLLFTGEEIDSLVEAGPENYLRTDLYRKVVTNLQKIKRANKNLTFAYILAPTESLTEMVFIADADVIATRPDLNFNIDEITDEGFPGYVYDVTDIQVIQDGSAFHRTVVNPDVYEDIWGTLYTGYAPIKKNDGKTVAILAIDIDISDYNFLVKATFLPFGLLTILMMMTLAVLAISLLRMWGSRVDLLRELDRQKDRVLGMVSHQLNNPITAIKWNLEGILDGDTKSFDKDQLDSLQTMSASAAQMADLSGMILDVSRFQLGKPKLDIQPVNLGDFFKEIVTMVEPKVREKKTKFVQKISENIPETMLLDKRLTRMTVENLLSNAVKYTPDGGSVDFIVENRSGTLYIEVRDTGIGIPEKDQSKMFSELFRASNTGGIDGNGFGLYIAKKAIESQGGKIWFTSKEGKGTTFMIELPIKQAEATQEKKA